MAVERITCPSCGESVAWLGGDVQACQECGATLRLPEGAPSGRIVAYGRLTALVLASVAAGGSALLIYAFFTFTARSSYGEEAIMSAVLAGVSAILFRLSGRRLLAVLVAVAGGAALIAKPLLHPMLTSSAEPFRLTSETHLNFLVPGGLLIGLGLLLALTIRAGRARRRLL